MKMRDGKLKGDMTDNDKEVALQNFKKGLGHSTIARMLKIRSNVVDRFLKQNGCKREQGDAIRARAKVGSFVAKDEDLKL